MELQIEQLMEELVQGGGSDLHLAAGQPPYGRLGGPLRPMREEQISEDQWNRLVSREPVQYVLRKAWFMGRTLEVDGSVLIPRPESEELVAWVLEAKENHAEAFLDLGTGSGCLALALACGDTEHAYYTLRSHCGKRYHHGRPGSCEPGSSPWP